MPYAQLRHHHGTQVVEIIDPVTGSEPLLRLALLDWERSDWRVITDALLRRRWHKSDRDVVLDTIEPYGWLPSGPTHPDTQVLDVIPTHVCPKCRAYLMVGSHTTVALLCSEESCGWEGAGWGAASRYMA